MGRKINNNQQSAENPFEDLCCEIYQGDYVLVIGNDAILKQSLEGNGNNKAFIDARVDEYLRERDQRVETIEERKNMISKFLKNEWSYDIAAEVNEDLVRLLHTKCFRVVLTTSFDGYVEEVMRDVWGDELHVINIYDKTPFGTYSEYELVRPTIVYAMGKADSATAKFVYTEDDAIELIAKRWLESTKRPNDLINYISSRKVLGIGCKLDDWEFRFFWYSLRQDLTKLHGDVAISLDDSETDLKLAKYLERKSVRDKGNSREFLHYLQKQLNDPGKYVYDRLSLRLQSGGVFISYASEDFDVVCHIYKLLRDQGCRVWFDNRQLLGGDRYDDRITSAIRECKVFIPVLSAQTAQDLRDGKERYYMKEWEQAADNTACHCIPVTLYGFDIKEWRSTLPKMLQDKTAISWNDNGSDALKESLKQKLNAL